jgi:hypothetical protein
MSARRPLAILHVDPERGSAAASSRCSGCSRTCRRRASPALAADPRRLAASRADLGVADGAARHPQSLRRRRRPTARWFAGPERYDILHFHTARAHAMAAFLGASPGVSRVVTGGWTIASAAAGTRGDSTITRCRRWLAISEGCVQRLIACGVEARAHPSRAERRRVATCSSGAATVDRRRARAQAPRRRVVVAIVGALEESAREHDVLLDALSRRFRIRGSCC